MSCILIVIIISLILDTLAPRTSFMQISSAIHYMSYFLLGILYSDYKKVIDFYLKKFWWVIVPIFLALSISLRLGVVPAALSGIIFSITLALLLEEKCSDKVVKISSLSYTVFLLSYFPQMLIRGPIAHHFPAINQYVLSTISFLAGLLLPIAFGLIFIKFKEKNKVFHKIGLLIGL